MQLENTFRQFEQYVGNQLKLFLNKNESQIPAQEIPGMDAFNFPGKTINHHESIILLTALTPHVQPALFDNAIKEYLPKGGEFAEFGGVRGTNTRYFLPTGDTALFLLAGYNVEQRLKASIYFHSSHWLYKENILILEPVKEGEPSTSGRLMVTEEFIDKLVFNRRYSPRYGQSFPAKSVTTNLAWQDVVLNEKTLQQVKDVIAWVRHNDILLDQWDMRKYVKPGYRVLFFGPSGTGKTLTATMLAKELSREIYRIDLSQVVSKYIGETEKNLERIFQRAESKDWILFFDEADALFGKRTNVRDAHDRYANQEVAYLLQRIEDFAGLVILASNFKGNIDQAFTRRFNAIIHFTMPTAEERYHLWKKVIPSKAALDDQADLKDLAQRYELSGAAIVNAIHYASLQALNNGTKLIAKNWLIEGIKREYEKEERVFIN